DARLFVAAEDLPYLVQSPPPDWSDEDRRLAALFVKTGLGGTQPAALGERDREELLYHLALYLRVLREEDATFHSLAAGKLEVRSGETTRQLALPAHLPTFRRLGDAVTGADLSLVPGDHLVLVWQGDRLLALEQEVHAQ